MDTKTGGFTVIEIMLFLGISGLLLIGVFIGTSTMISSARFADTMKGVESYIQRQFDEVVNGVNPRQATETCTGSGSERPGTGSCLLLGKVIAFTPNKEAVWSQYVVGTEPPTLPGTSVGTSQALSQYNLRVVATNADSYELPWGGYFKAGKRDSDGGAVNAIAYLRSPTSSHVETYVFSVPDSSRDTDGKVTSINFSQVVGAAMVAQTANNAAHYCIDSPDGLPGQYRGSVEIARGQGAATIFGKVINMGEVAPC